MRIYLPETEYEWYKVAVNCQEYTGKNKKKWILSRFEQLHPFFSQNSLWGYTVRREKDELVLYGAVSDSYVMPPAKKTFGEVRFYVRNSENGISFPLYVGKKRSRKHKTFVLLLSGFCLCAASISFWLYNSRQATCENALVAEAPQEASAAVSSVDLVRQVFSALGEYVQASKSEGGFLKSVDFVFETAMQVQFELKDLPTSDFTELCRTLPWLQPPAIHSVSYVQNKPHYLAKLLSPQSLYSARQNDIVVKDSLLFFEKLVMDEAGFLQTMQFERDGSGASVSCQIPLLKANHFFTQLFFSLQEKSLEFKGLQIGLADEKYLQVNAALVPGTNTFEPGRDYGDVTILPLFVPQKQASKSHLARQTFGQNKSDVIGQKLGEVRQLDGANCIFYKQTDGKIILVSEGLQ